MLIRQHHTHSPPEADKQGLTAQARARGQGRALGHPLTPRGHPKASLSPQISPFMAYGGGVTNADGGRICQRTIKEVRRSRRIGAKSIQIQLLTNLVGVPRDRSLTPSESSRDRAGSMKDALHLDPEMIIQERILLSWLSIWSRREFLVKVVSGLESGKGLRLCGETPASKAWVCSRNDSMLGDRKRRSLFRDLEVSGRNCLI